MALKDRWGRKATPDRREKSVRKVPSARKARLEPKVPKATPVQRELTGRKVLKDLKGCRAP
ncbi:MAG: hypothetical protein Aurels2KO_52560 [Aureliella sp.]